MNSKTERMHPAEPPRPDDMLKRDATLRRIVDRVVELCRPVRIVLFGSRARGDHDEGSDYDLVVVVRRVPAALRRYPNVLEAIGSVGAGLDVFLYTEQGFRKARAGRNTVATIAEEEGITIYAA